MCFISGTSNANHAAEAAPTPAVTPAAPNTDVAEEIAPIIAGEAMDATPVQRFHSAK